MRIMILLSMVFFFLSGCCIKQEENELEPIEMVVATEEVAQEIIACKLPRQTSIIFQNQKGPTELILYCDDTEMYSDVFFDEYTHLLINGQEFVLNTFGKSFYLREGVPPCMIWYDWNDDGVEDLILWSETDRTGYLQYAFASTKEGKYCCLGSANWRMNSGMCSYETFPYNVTLLDDYKIKIELKVADICAIYDIRNNSFLKHCAIPLGMYDKKGNVTELGKSWNFTSAGLYEQDIRCSSCDDGSLNMNITSYIGAGYSNYDLGCGFVFNWKISKEGYVLIGIESFCQ